MNLMRKNVLLVFLTLGLFGCGVGKQAQQITALKDCKFKIVSVNQARLAGADIKQIIDGGDINIGSLPGFALGLLRKNIPLNATFNLEISNPSAVVAALNQFDYKILINRTELAEGTVNQSINVAQGEKQIVPITIGTNVYSLLSDQNILNDVMKAAKKDPKNKSLGLLTIKIRPTFMIGNTAVKYPGYISIDKEVSSNILF